MPNQDPNFLDNRIINDFGNEWSRFHYLNNRDSQSIKDQFYLYSEILNLDSTHYSKAADFGAGSGRWTELLLPHVDHVFAIEPSSKAFEILKLRFSRAKKVSIQKASIEQCSIDENTLDLAICLGVLHHVPNIHGSIEKIYSLLKPGGTFLGYLYYNFENRSALYRLIWRLSDYIRKFVSALPKRLKFLICDLIALLIYFPLSKISKALQAMNLSVSNFPLHHYSDLSFYVMRNDALDRFGTTLEVRFSQQQIINIFAIAGFDVSTMKYSEKEPFWTFKVQKPFSLQ